MKKTDLSKIEEYDQVLKDIRFLLDKAKAQAYKAVDNVRVQTYWQIGERIVREELQHKERADYGQYLLDNLAHDLGFSRRLMFEIVQFYRTYPIVQTVSAQLSWSHIVELIKLAKKEERDFYGQQIIQNGWSVRIVHQEIKKKLYQKASQKGTLAIKKRLPLKTIEPEQIFKEVYHFNFLSLDENSKETEFKDALLNKFEKLLQELGSDFFIGRREVPILIAGNYDKIDLELFHAGLLCYILVEIKTEEFKHSHVSQMYSYLNWYKENKLKNGQRLPIGLIICKTKDDETVHYALGGLKKEIFVAEYKIKLPSEQEIKSKLK
ncbi:DUF1016 domain-containing protein [Candidatus Woesearchaeota archaeon]|nr:DUF1016 domain-containing protein [Candidatus Woesearchaeota archaeon]